MFKKPKILDVQTAAKTKIFNIETVDLEFSNKQKRKYERLNSSSNGAVLIVPMLDDDTVIMVYEYAVGTERYELALAKGKIDDNEKPIEAANRELMEEVGYAAKDLKFIKTMTLAPNYQSSATHIILARDLYKAKSFDGDEPEPLEVVKHKLSELDSLVYRQDITEARSIAALYMVKAIIKNGD
jgi:ADP-ribose diphosphatase